MADRHRRTSGFTFLEMTAVMLILSILLLMSVPAIRQSSLPSADELIHQIVMDQYKAITSSRKVNRYLKRPDCSYGFNRRGNASAAQSIYLGKRRIIISLGTGRCYVYGRWTCDD